MTIKNFIERAIEGGWDAQKSLCIVFLDEIRVEGLLRREYVSQILLDPLAWAAVGKAIGKTNIHGGLITMCRNCSVESGANSLGSCDYCGGHEWGNFQRWDRYSMDRLIDSLCDGLSLEEAFDKATS